MEELWVNGRYLRHHASKGEKVLDSLKKTPGKKDRKGQLNPSVKEERKVVGKNAQTPR